MNLDAGIHDNISPADYHADRLRADVTLSRSGIVTLLNSTPAEFAARNPRLTKWPEILEEDGTDSTDLGSVVHALVLGGNGGAKYIVGAPQDHLNLKGDPYSTWSGKAGDWKREQKANGYIVIDHATNAKAHTIADSVVGAIVARFGANAWSYREVEQTLIWKRRLNDGSEIWCRARPDCILPGGAILDIKTTALPLSDAELGKRIAADGSDVQCAWYQDGKLAVELEGAKDINTPPERPPFIFAFVQTIPPYSVRFADLDAIGWPLHLTRMRIDLACHRFGEGIMKGEWPGHPIDAAPTVPPWAVSAWERQVGIDGEIETP
jgi:hypothetical protein